MQPKQGQTPRLLFFSLEHASCRREVERGSIAAKSSSRPSWNSLAPSTVYMEALKSRGIQLWPKGCRWREHTWDRAELQETAQEGMGAGFQRHSDCRGGRSWGEKDKQARKGLRANYRARRAELDP